MPYFSLIDHNPSLHSDYQEGSIEITDQQYAEFLQALLDGFFFEIQDGLPVILSKTMRFVYHTANQQALEIAVNALIPDGYTLLQPPSPAHIFENGAWILTSDAEEEIRRNQVLAQIATIEAGLTSRLLTKAILGDAGSLAALTTAESQIVALEATL